MKYILYIVLGLFAGIGLYNYAMTQNIDCEDTMQNNYIVAHEITSIAEEYSIDPSIFFKNGNIMSLDEASKMNNIPYKDRMELFSSVMSYTYYLSTLEEFDLFITDYESYSKAEKFISQKINNDSKCYIKLSN